MSAAISPATHRPYGVPRVCRIWAVPRSTLYQTRRPADGGAAKPRGPRPPIEEASLLAALQADLAVFRPGSPQSLGAPALWPRSAGLPQPRATYTLLA